MRTLILILVFSFLVVSAHAAIKDYSPSDWTRVLQEVGVQAEQPLIEKFTRSSETLDKINLQTRGTLQTAEWVEIFNKLHLEPKSGMQLQEWEKLFRSLGIKAKCISSEQTSQLQPEPAASTANNQSPQPQAETLKNEPPMSASSAPAASTTPAAAQTPLHQDTPAIQQQVSTPPPPTPVALTPAQSQEPVKPAPRQEEQIRSSSISLDLRGMDILSVLKMISQKSELNIIAGNNVKGNVTIYLKDVNAVDALKMILEMNDLAYVYEDKVIKVMTAQDYERIYGRKFYDRTIVEIVNLVFGKADNIAKTITSVKSKIGQIIADSASNSLIIIDTPENINDLKKMIETLDVKIETKVFPLNYTKAKEIADKLKNTLSPNISDIQIDERSNQLIVTDATKKMAEISQLISSLDKRHREVLIEAKIVQLMHDDSINMGISWESVFNKVNNNVIAGKVVGNLSNLSQPQAINVGGPTGIQLNVGTLSIDNFTAVLDMLQTIGKTNLVASPRIAAIENKEAKILVGTKEAYVTTQVSNPGSTTTNPIVAESVNFVDVGMKLFVTPSIGEDGFITMKIRPEVSSVDRILKTSQNNPIPIVRTSESETTVMVKDGITIIIAGLMEEKEIKKTEGIPFISRIPLLGIPFRRTSSEKIKTELVVFLTPRIMTGDITSEEYQKHK